MCVFFKNILFMLTRPVGQRLTSSHTIKQFNFTLPRINIKHIGKHSITNIVSQLIISYFYSLPPVQKTIWSQLREDVHTTVSILSKQYQNITLSTVWRTRQNTLYNTRQNTLYIIKIILWPTQSNIMSNACDHICNPENKHKK